MCLYLQMSCCFSRYPGTLLRKWVKVLRTRSVFCRRVARLVASVFSGLFSSHFSKKSFLFSKFSEFFERNMAAVAAWISEMRSITTVTSGKVSPEYCLTLAKPFLSSFISTMTPLPIHLVKAHEKSMSFNQFGHTFFNFLIWNVSLTLKKILVLFWNCHDESFISMIQNSNLRQIFYCYFFPHQFKMLLVSKCK